MRYSRTVERISLISTIRSQLERIICSLIILCSVLFSSRAAIAEAINYDEGLQQVQQFTKASDLTGAEALLREMLIQYPDNAELLHFLARVLYWGKRYDESIEAYDRLMTIRPSDEAREDLRKVRAAKELRSAEELQKQGKYREAEEKLREMYLSGKDRYAAGYGLGMMYTGQREYTKARDVFSELRRSYPDDRGMEELYLESLIMAGDITIAKAELNGLGKERKQELYRTREDLFYRARRNYVRLSASSVDYTKDIETEKQYEVQLSQRVAERPFVFSYTDISRFGKKDGQAGLEIYSMLGEKTKRWGYLYVTASTEAEFLPRWTAGGTVYQGYRDVDLSLGYSHMEFREESVDRLVPGIIIYLPYGLALTESLSINLRNRTTSLLSKVHWEPNHRFNGFYSYSFGRSAERIGAVEDLEKVGNYTHTAGFEYRLKEYLSLGAEFRFDSRENSYEQRGLLFFTKIWW